MKALVITQKKLLPMADGALVGSMGLLNYLHDLGHTIQVIHFVEDDDYTVDELRELSSLVDKIHTVKLHWRSTALNLSLKYPNSIRKYTRKSFFKKVYEVKKEFKPDFAVIDHTQMYEYSKCFEDIYCVLHTHNVESNVWFDYAKDKKGIFRKLVLRSAKMLREYEKKALSEVTCVTACSENDYKIFKTMVPDSNVEVFHTYLKFDLIKENKDILNTTKTILYVGSYSWYPNQLAAKFLVEELMPELRTKIKGIKLYLVGKDPTEEMLNYSNIYKDIFITGMVDTIDPYLKTADVFVNAVEDGGGINIKLIEAMGKGIPVVSSIFGIRGTTVEDGKEVCIYDSLQSCVDYVIRIIEDKEFAIELSNNSREYYLEFIKPSCRVCEIFKGKTNHNGV